MIPIGSEGRSCPSVGAASRRVHHVHPVAHLAEHRVLAVQPRSGVGGDDEELRAVRVRAGVGHRERAANDLVVVELVLEGVAGAARAGAKGAAALDHEVLDHAVEGEAVVEALAGEPAEVLDRLRGVGVEQLERDRPLGGLHRGGGHGPNLPAPRPARTRGCCAPPVPRSHGRRRRRAPTGRRSGRAPAPRGRPPRRGPSRRSPRTRCRPP